MKTLRRGDRGPDVVRLQEALNTTSDDPMLVVDGDFGHMTEIVVEAFQEVHGLLVDGVVGRATWTALGVEDDLSEWSDLPVEWTGWKTVPCDLYPGDGYDSTTLRSDVAAAFTTMRMELVASGGIITSAGGRRRVRKNAKPNQATKSLHYLGRAHDLALPSGMHDPMRDPYVVEKDPENPRYWIVWARADRGEERAVDAWVHATQSTRRVTGRFVNLTELMARNGFERIKARGSYRADNYGAAEWWHFQYTRDLEHGVTKFGTELLKVWSPGELEGTTPWEHREALWGVDWF